MTKRRVTVSLPADVAEYLEREGNASAAVTDALRARMNRGAATLAMLRAAGFDITDEGLARARGKLPPPTQDMRAEVKQRADMARAGTLPARDTARSGAAEDGAA